MAYERIMGLNVIDDTEYQRYREAMLPLLKTYDGAFGYDFRVSEVLLSKHNENINRVFTIEFPSKKIMQAFFEDPEYVLIQNRHFKNAVASKTVIAIYEKNKE